MIFHPIKLEMIMEKLAIGLGVLCGLYLIMMGVISYYVNRNQNEKRKEAS